MRCCEEEEIYEDWRDNPKNFPEDQTLFNLNDKIMVQIYNYVGAECPEKATEKQITNVAMRRMIIYCPACNIKRSLSMDKLKSDNEICIPEDNISMSPNINKEAITMTKNNCTKSIIAR